MGLADEYREFGEFAWRRLGAKKRLVGRKRVAAMLARAVEAWSDDVADGEGPPYERVVAIAANEAQAEQPDRYGFVSIILAGIISALASELVKLLIQWWKDKQAHRDLLAQWRQYPIVMEPDDGEGSR